MTQQATGPNVVAVPTKPQLPGALMPIICDVAEGMLEHTGADGRPFWLPDQKWNSRNWYATQVAAVAFAADDPANRTRGDERLVDLLARGGRTLVAQFTDADRVDLDDKLWFDGNRPHEWITESWLQTWEQLRAAGVDASVFDGWADVFRCVGATYKRYVDQLAGIRRMTSPNLKISTNHFAFFAAILVRIGQLFDEPSWVDAGIDTLLRIVDHQHPDGYWAETHGPSTHYNFVTADAIALAFEWTGEPRLGESLQRALDFHARWLWPDATVVATVDQRVRNRGVRPLNWLSTFSHTPAGRGWAEWVFASAQANGGWPLDDGGGVGALATCYRNYHTGDGVAPAAAGDHVSRLSDQPAGIVRRGPWAGSLVGIPSRKRVHRYTLDRQNLLGVWHAAGGLIIGGGNSRYQPELGTFHSHLPVDASTRRDDEPADDIVHTPVDATLELTETGGRLDLEYWGFDATLELAIVDDSTARITAAVASLPANDPVWFTPNIWLDQSAGPIATAAGESLPVAADAEPWQRTGEQLGGSFGQGRWRIDVPADAVLRGPIVPYSPSPGQQTPPVAALDIRATNRTIEIAVRIID